MDDGVLYNNPRALSTQFAPTCPRDKKIPGGSHTPGKGSSQLGYASSKETSGPLLAESASIAAMVGPNLSLARMAL